MGAYNPSGTFNGVSRVLVMESIMNKLLYNILAAIALYRYILRTKKLSI